MVAAINPPLLTPMPPAPLPTDAEAVFDAKAGASLVAQDNLVDEQNIALAWQAEAMADTKAARDAAAGSAGSAAGSATTATQQAQLATENGQAQVSLAVTARQDAEAARDQAQVYAQAAQAGTVPSPFPSKFLGSDVDGNVLWKEAGQAIGDILVTTKSAQPVGYVLPDKVYSRAAYPELLAIIGTINQYNDAENFAAINPFSGVGFNTSDVGIAVGKDDVWLCVGYISSENSSSSCGFKSVDGGATWVQVAALSGKRSLRSVDTDGKGVWLAASYDGYGYRSADNGLTWSAAIDITGGGAALSYVVTNKEGVWLASFPGSTACTISTDNGLTWKNNVFSQVHNHITFAGAFYSGNGNSMERSTDGVNWAAALSGSSSFSKVLGNAGIAVVQSIGRLLASTDNGISWFSVLEGSPILSNQWNVDQNGVIHVRQVNTASRFLRSKMVRSYDCGASWIESDIPSGAAAGSLGLGKYDSLGNWVIIQTATSLWRATRQYNYDAATQFKTPPVKVNRFQKAFIKARAI